MEMHYIITTFLLSYSILMTINFIKVSNNKNKVEVKYKEKDNTMEVFGLNKKIHNLNMKIIDLNCKNDLLKIDLDFQVEKNKIVSSNKGIVDKHTLQRVILESFLEYEKNTKVSVISAEIKLYNTFKSKPKSLDILSERQISLKIEL